MLRGLLPGPDPAPDLLALYGGAAPDRYLRAGLVRSLDGAVAVGGLSSPLSGDADRAVLRALRAVCDVVLVGAGTARAEDYRSVRVAAAAAGWRAGQGLAPTPPVAVVSRALRLDPGSRLFTDTMRPIVVTCEQSPADRRLALSQVADVLVAGDERVDLAEALRQLADRGLTRVLCEGGPSLLTGALRAGLVDEMCVTTAPLLVGGGPLMLPEGLESPVALRLVHLLVGEDGSLLARYTVAPDTATMTPDLCPVAALRRDRAG